MTAATTSEYTFHYFPLYVRGEAIRMLLSHAGVPFTNNAIEFANWKDLKATMPNSQVPCLEITEDSQKFG